MLWCVPSGVVAPCLRRAPGTVDDPLAVSPRKALIVLSLVGFHCAGMPDAGGGADQTASPDGSAGASLSTSGAAGAVAMTGTGGSTTGGSMSTGGTTETGGSSVGASGGQAGAMTMRDSGASCANACPQDGAQLCVSPTSFERCGAAAGGCLGWSAPTACPSGQVCSAGVCAIQTCKRGLGYVFDDATVASDMPALKSVAWFYNWTATVSSQVGNAMAPARMEFVPMVWGKNIDVDDIVNHIPAGAKYLLGFNEPNFGIQSNLTPTQAAQLWPQVEQIAQRKNLKIVSPAVNTCGSPCNVQDPVAWMDQFFAACTSCKVDHIAIHWYACTRDSLQTYVARFKKYNKPLWVTEFACADQGVQPVDRQRAYLRDALSYMESEPAIFRYSWFSGRTTEVANVDLLAGAGQLTALGQDYQSLAPAGTCQR